MSVQGCSAFAGQIEQTKSKGYCGWSTRKPKTIVLGYGVPKMPSEFSFSSGWTKCVKVEYPVCAWRRRLARGIRGVMRA